MLGKTPDRYMNDGEKKILGTHRIEILNLICQKHP